MYTIKAVLGAFLAGVILAGGVTYWVAKPAAGPSPNDGLVCAPAPTAAPSPIPTPADMAARKAREHAELAPTTGGDRPAAHTLSVPPANDAPASSGSKEH